jgi:hypothetical protein
MVIRLPDIRVPSGCKMPATVAFKSGQDSCHRPVKLIVTKQRLLVGPFDRAWWAGEAVGGMPYPK